MKVAHRLFIAVVPAVLGVLLVAALAYWGQYAHAAPLIVVLTAAVAAVASLVITWHNTRYVALRIEQLAEKVHGRDATGDRRATTTASPDAASADELDAIESVVDRFAAAIVAADARRAQAEHSADARVREHAALLADLSDALTNAVTEVRLPLHILLENHFGDLNETQEEMLEAARAAAEVGTTALGRVGEIAALDGGTDVLRRDRVKLGDLLESLRPTLDAEAARAGAVVRLDVQPALPGVLGDRARLHEAIGLLLGDCVRRSPRGAEVAVSLEGAAGTLRLDVRHGAQTAPTVDWVLAQRILLAHGANVARGPQRLTVTIPAMQLVVTA